MNGELLRLVDSIHRDKNIDREVLLDSIEQALASAVRKAYGSEEITVTIDPETGDISATDGEREFDPVSLGRIAAQTAKQVMIQKIREAERDVIFDEYEDRIGQIVTGTVQRFEGGALIVNMGKTEGILPRGEQIPGEVYQPGDRIRVMVLDVRKVGPRVKIVLTRTHPEFIVRLFELEVPEVSERVIEIKGLAREPGQRTKIAVSSIDSKVDCVGACVGVRGSRIKNIVDEVNGEKIDIVRWNDSTEVLIMASLKPAEVANIELDSTNRRARVIVPEDQLSLAIGKKGQNVRLASRLSGWDIDIVSEAEAEVLSTVETVEIDFHDVEGIEPEVAEVLENAGLRTLRDVFSMGEEGLTEIEGISPEAGSAVVRYATDVYQKLAEEAMARARAGAREERPPTPREILESMIPDLEGQDTDETPTSEAGPVADEASPETPQDEETETEASPETPQDEETETEASPETPRDEETETEDNQTTPVDA